MNIPPLIRRADAVAELQRQELRKGQRRQQSAMGGGRRMVEGEGEKLQGNRWRTETEVPGNRQQLKGAGQPEEPKRENENYQQRRSVPTADVRRPRRLADADHRPLNQTFTITTSARKPPTPLFRARRGRSNSIDSDFGDYGTDALFGLMSRDSRTKSRERSQANSMGRDRRWEFSWRPPGAAKPKSFSSASILDGSTKLPSLEGFCPGRTSCQLQHITRSQFELIKYKRNLNS